MSIATPITSHNRCTRQIILTLHGLSLQLGLDYTKSLFCLHPFENGRETKLLFGVILKWLTLGGSEAASRKYRGRR